MTLFIKEHLVFTLGVILVALLTVTATVAERTSATASATAVVPTSALEQSSVPSTVSDGGRTSTPAQVAAPQPSSAAAPTQSVRLPRERELDD